MDNTLQHEPYVFVSEITPTTKGFQHAVSTMNCQEKASFEIPSKWMYGKAGIPSNIPPHTDFILKIHRMETEQQDEETQLQVEIGLQVNHTEEQKEMGILTLSDKELTNRNQKDWEHTKGRFRTSCPVVMTMAIAVE